MKSTADCKKDQLFNCMQYYLFKSVHMYRMYYLPETTLPNQKSITHK